MMKDWFAGAVAERYDDDTNRPPPPPTNPHMLACLPLQHISSLAHTCILLLA